MAAGSWVKPQSPPRSQPGDAGRKLGGRQYLWRKSSYLFRQEVGLPWGGSQSFSGGDWGYRRVSLKSKGHLRGPGKLSVDSGCGLGKPGASWEWEDGHLGSLCLGWGHRGWSTKIQLVPECWTKCSLKWVFIFSLSFWLIYCLSPLSSSSQLWG